MWPQSDFLGDHEGNAYILTGISHVDAVRVRLSSNSFPTLDSQFACGFAGLRHNHSPVGPAYGFTRSSQPTG